MQAPGCQPDGDAITQHPVRGHPHRDLPPHSPVQGSGGQVKPWATQQSRSPPRTTHGSCSSQDSSAASGLGA